MSRLVTELWRRARPTRYLELQRWVTEVVAEHPAVHRVGFVRCHLRTGRCWVLGRGVVNGRIEVLTVSASERSVLARARHEPQRLDEGHLLRVVGLDHALVAAVLLDASQPSYLAVEPVHEDEELFDDLRILATITGQLIENLTEKQRRRRAERRAITDPLTRLANRSFGMKSLRHEVARARRGEHDLSILMVDLDGFKALNDQHGHLIGDRALRTTANVLRETVRASDVIFRYGGEEFLVILPCTCPDEAAVLAARLFVEVEQAGREQDLPITVSIGLASLRRDDQLDSLIGRADRALYASKLRGRNRFSADVD